MGLTSVMMHYLSYIDPVIVAVASDPFDPDNGLFEVHRHNQPIVIAFDVEYDPFVGHDACCRVAPLHVGHALPFRLADFREPRISVGTPCLLILVSGATAHK